MNQTDRLPFRQLTNNTKTQQLSLYIGAMEVFDQLINTFNQKHLNSCSTILLKSFPLKKQYEDNINILFEHIYQKLVSVFESWPDPSTVSQNWHLNQNKQPQQDELYGILNQYKIENKKLKEHKKQLEEKMYKKQIEMQQMIQNYRQLQQCFKNIKNQNIYLEDQCSMFKNQIISLQNQVKVGQSQKEEYQRTISEKDILIQLKNKQIQELCEQYNNCNKQKQKCELKKEMLKQLVEKKINENLPKMQSLIKQKIKSKNQNKVQIGTVKTILNFMWKDKQLCNKTQFEQHKNQN